MNFLAGDVPPLVMAFTVTVPTPWAGESTLISVALTKVTVLVGIAVPPNVTAVAPEMKSVPVRVTTVPPVVGPPSGVTPVMVGGP